MKTTDPKSLSLSGGPRGYDAGKKIKGRKRQLAVDLEGLLIVIGLHSASLDDLIAPEKSAADTSAAKQYWKNIMATSTPHNQHNTLRQLSAHYLSSSQATPEEPDA